MVNLFKTSFNSILFLNSKLIGLHFEDCNQFTFDVRFENCNLNLSSFFKLKIKKTKFINSSLQDVEFNQTDLTSSQFENCNLLNSKFINSILENVDFKTSYNFSIDLEMNKVKGAKFSIQNIIGLLDKYDIEII